MSPQKIMVWIMTAVGGSVGLFAPVGVVKWLLQSEPEDAGISPSSFFRSGVSSW